MTGVLNEMRGTNRLILKESVFHYSEEKSRSVLRFYTLHLLICTYIRTCTCMLHAYWCRVEWMYDYQGMVILAANQVWWTWEVEDVFRKVKKGDKMGMKNYSKKLHSQIDDLVVQVKLGSRTPEAAHFY